MKRYLVKETSIATKTNPTFAGEHSITYFGKECRQLKREGTHIPCDNFDYTHWIEEYGYKSEAMARRSWVYKNPENSKFWQSTVEIVSVEC